MILHVYGQRWRHDSATIVGDREALESLRNAIDAVLNGHEVTCEVFVADGEGYICRVMLRSEEQLRALHMPYSDEDAQGSSQDKEWPSDY